AEEVPREVLVPELPASADALTQWLCDRRGTRVSFREPRRGEKRALFETVARNAEQACAQHKLRRASGVSARSRALQEIQDALMLAEAPLRIECFDVSHVQGTNVVASMVVFEDGLARKGEYRRFAMRGEFGEDDTAWIHETVRRRFVRYLDERVDSGDLGDGDGEQAGAGAQPIDPETGRPRKFAYPPNLVVVDGGPPQVAAAYRALTERGIEDVGL